MFVVKSLVSLVVAGLSLAGSSVLGKSLATRNEVPETSLQSVEEIKLEEVTPTPKEEVSTESEPVVEVEETVVVSEPPHLSRLTVERLLMGVTRNGKGPKSSYVLKSDFFDVANEIKVRDSAIWNDFQNYAGKTDIDTVENACRFYAKRLITSFGKRSNFINRIKDFCFVRVA